MDVFSVTEINNHLKNIVEGNIPNVFIAGEVANFKKHSSGHIYFSLKDSNSTIRAIFFSYLNRYLDFIPQNGDRVICAGKITVYGKGGYYQINIRKMIPEGKGKQQLEFEELKRKLSQEGLFDEDKKKSIPTFPEKIGILTSATSAAFQDIKNVLNRRFPVEIQLYSVIVQGKTAPNKIIEGINFLNKIKDLDLIILARGGGSQEDLFCFNDESLARTIFHSMKPIITGIGHEIDYTIADFVSDKRAPTPSAAAEIAVPSKFEVMQYLDDIYSKINHLKNNKISQLKLKLSNFDKVIKINNPVEKVKSYRKQLNNLCQNLNIINKAQILKKDRLRELKNEMNSLFKLNSEKQLSYYGNKIENLSQKLINAVDISAQKNKVENLSNILEDLSPKKALKRGYSIIRKEKKVLKRLNDFEIDKEVEIIINDGKLKAVIKEILSKENK